MSSKNCCFTATSSVDSYRFPLTDPLSFVDSRTTKSVMPKIYHNHASSTFSEKCKSCAVCQDSVNCSHNQIYSNKMSSKCGCGSVLRKILTKLQRLCKCSKYFQAHFSLVLLLFVFSSLYYTSDARPAPRYSPGRQLILQTSRTHRLHNHNQRIHFQQQKQHQEQNSLLHQRIAQAFPTTRRHHHLSHRSAPTMHPTGAKNLNCPNLDSNRRQAENTLNTIKNKLNVYTANQFNTDDPLELSEAWKAIPLNFNHHFMDVFRGKEEHQRLKNIDKKFGEETIKQKVLKNRPLNNEVLSEIMLNIYSTLLRFNKGLETVIRIREENRQRLLNDLANDSGKFEAITNFLKEVQDEINFNIRETNATLHDLNIEEPKDVDLEWSYEQPNKVQEWKLIEEQIVTIKLLAEVYSEIMCNANSADQNNSL